MTHCRRCAADRTRRGSRTKTEILPGFGLLETRMPVLAVACVAACPDLVCRRVSRKTRADHKIGACPIYRLMRPIFGRIRLSGTIDHDWHGALTDSGRVGSLLAPAVERPKPAAVLYNRQSRQHAEILSSMWLTSSGM